MIQNQNNDFQIHQRMMKWPGNITKRDFVIHKIRIIYLDIRGLST